MHQTRTWKRSSRQLQATEKVHSRQDCATSSNSSVGRNVAGPQEGLPRLALPALQTHGIGRNVESTGPSGVASPKTMADASAQTTGFRDLVTKAILALKEGTPFPLGGTHSDLSSLEQTRAKSGWGRNYLPKGEFLQQTASRWTMRQHSLHITQQEALAVMLGVQGLGSTSPGSDDPRPCGRQLSVLGTQEGHSQPQIGTPLQQVAFWMAQGDM